MKKQAELQERLIQLLPVYQAAIALVERLDKVNPGFDYPAWWGKYSDVNEDWGLEMAQLYKIVKATK